MVFEFNRKICRLLVLYTELAKSITKNALQSIDFIENVTFFLIQSVEWLMYNLQDGLFETWKMLSFGSDTKKNRIIAKIFINFKVLKFL